jgi:hypothetical protein
VAELERTASIGARRARPRRQAVSPPARKRKRFNMLRLASTLQRQQMGTSSPAAGPQKGRRTLAGRKASLHLRELDVPQT